MSSVWWLGPGLIVQRIFTRWMRQEPGCTLVQIGCMARVEGTTQCDSKGCVSNRRGKMSGYACNCSNYFRKFPTIITNRNNNKAIFPSLSTSVWTEKLTTVLYNSRGHKMSHLNGATRSAFRLCLIDMAEEYSCQIYE